MPIPTMNDKGWEALMNKELALNTITRDEIPQALQQLMSEGFVSGATHKVWEISNMMKGN